VSEFDWELRDTLPSDTDAIDRLLRACFDSDVEAELVKELRRDGDAAIELVAESDAGIVGYVMLSRMRAPDRALGLGPVATGAEHRGAGVGSSLIESALALATADDWQSVFLLGDPAFYGRFGFDVDDAATYEGAFAGPYLQVTFLDEEAPRSGRADYARAFSRFEESE
jgi:putative acetyltransferase